MDIRTAAIMQWVAESVAAFPSVQRVVLFGSRARGDNQERSDFDLAIEAPTADPVAWDAIVEAIDLAPTLLTLDVLRLETASQAMKAEIERDGVVIHGRRTRAA